jgi:hypothetical protein
MGALVVVFGGVVRASPKRNTRAGKTQFSNLAQETPVRERRDELRP